MYLTISLLMAIAPSIALVVYFYKQDKRKPEPKGLITRVFFLGILFILPAGVVEYFFDIVFKQLNNMPLLYHSLKAFIIAAFIEELFKLILIKKFVYNNPHFDEIMDGIVYTIVASLGFACLENVIYVIDGGMGIALIRAFTAVPMHALASGIMGYYIGKAKFSEPGQQEKSLIYKGLRLAIVIHGFYNFFLFASPDISYLLAVGVIPLIILTFLNLKKKIKSAIKEDSEAGRHLEQTGDCG